MFTEITEKNGLVYYKSDNISYPHGFSTRHGGVSGAPHLRSLNLGNNRGDAPENVVKNFEIFLGALGLSYDRLVSAAQIHSANVRVVTAADAGGRFDDCDGFVTSDAGVVLCVKVADCIPILFADEKAGVIGAVHAGWRGAVSGIASVCIDKMRAMGARTENIHAAIGAGIRPCCYEVGEDFAETVKNIAGEDVFKKHLKARGAPGKYSADIVGISRDFILGRGVPAENISECVECTCCSPDKFFSHRFTGGKRGTMCAVISKGN